MLKIIYLRMTLGSNFMTVRTPQQIPEHLKKYIVEQNYARYTPIDQAVWRYCLRQLKKFLSLHGHSSYLSGLEKTGINIESIPHIDDMSTKLQKFGWRALPVSGFIPPAAFMELQSLGILPIASDMRSIDHLQYTPAPDIVHEAAGHAPILVDPEYADYLRQYSQVARKSIISKEDLDIYEAIRELSDLKENPNTTSEQIRASEKKLMTVSHSMTHVSEASQLSRMNWWTAEYGLIGDIKNPQIFGAGLLSSVGEAKWCLSDQVKKIPLTIDCIHQSYDITEPQPQLFVTPDFKTLVNVLNEFSNTMAYKMGGQCGLDKALQAKSVNTVELDSGLQVSGVLSEYIVDPSKNIIFIKFSGPTQICFADQELEGHSKNYHVDGYSTPVGSYAASSEVVGENVIFNFKSGFEIRGQLTDILILNSKAKIYRFEQATATYNQRIYFKPEWGTFDIVTGSAVASVFGGPADRIKYGEMSDFTALRVPEAKPSDQQKKLFLTYQELRDLRQLNNLNQIHAELLFKKIFIDYPQEWLLYIELLELCYKHHLSATFLNQVKEQLNSIKKNSSNLAAVIDDGLLLANE